MGRDELGMYEAYEKALDKSYSKLTPQHLGELKKLVMGINFKQEIGRLKHPVKVQPPKKDELESAIENAVKEIKTNGF